MSIYTLRDVDPKTIATHKEKLQYETARIGTCWVWTKTLDWDGYGHTKFSGKNAKAHRVSYLIYKGDIPSGMFVRHCCPGGENRACVNPDHLVLGTICENNRDTSKRGKGGRGGPKPELRESLIVEVSSLESDRLLRAMAHKNMSSSEIAQQLQLPVDHVEGVLNGELSLDGTRRASRFEVRFWTKVKKTPSCWLWKAMICAGYGRLRVGSTMVGAHQVSWRLHRGPIPEGIVVCHKCPDKENPRCVNPAHLYIASQTQNMRDAARKRFGKCPSTYIN